jgi:hypothetical protein
MVTLEKLSFDEASARNLFALYLETPESFPDGFTLSSPRFVCLLAWDARDVDGERIAELAAKLLNAGAVYVCAWGPDCKRVHDIIDKVHVGPNPPKIVDRVVMTTWHSDEPLAEAIWFALNSTNPDEGYALGCASTLGVAIGNLGWHEEICSAFRDSSGFSSSI